ncbi:MAG: hypothetical protein ACP5IC_02175, partial [Minisyncoccia bacterium]
MKQEKINIENILADYKSKDELLEIPLSNRIFQIILIAMAVILLVVVGRLFYFNVIKYDFYLSKANANAFYTKIFIAPRGIIFDRFGKPLLK